MENAISLNGFWRFCIDPNNIGVDQKWMVQENQPYLEDKTRIIVPSCWNRKTWKQYADYRGVAWYWRVFRIPAHFAGKKVMLQFQGMAHQATIYIDEEEIGGFQGAFIPFELEITKFADHKDHFIAIRIDGTEEANRYPKTSAAVETFLGIFGSVSMYPVETIVVDEFSMKTTVKNENYAEIEFSIYCKNTANEDYNGKIHINISRDFVPVASTEREVDILKNNSRLSKIIVPIEKPDLWTPENPILHNLSIKIGKADKNLIEISEIIGIREIEAKEDQIVLNKKPYDFRGFDFEIGDPNFGYTMPTTWLMDKLMKLKEININCIRPDQGMFTPFMVEMASRLGFLIIEDVPVVSLSLSEKQTFFKGYVDHISFQPSLAVWSINRKIDQANPGNNKAILDLQKLFTGRLDSTRNFIASGTFGAKSWVVNTNAGLKDILKDK